jgi:hypothetical protein
VKPSIYLALMAFGLTVVCPAASRPAASDPDRWTVQEQEHIERTLTLSGEPMRVVVDNVEGHVHVTGSNGSQVHVIAHKTIRAETKSDLQEAKNDVKLEMTEKPGTVSIYYDAPWRCNGGRGCHGEYRHFYEVVYDIDVEVPHTARVVASTVNDGDVRVDRIAGNFDVSNVNGGISMTGISGSGDIHTVNGPVSVRFVKNPSETTSFKSVNGPLDAYFQPGLSADLQFKTLNGEIYSDFEVTPTAIPAAETERHNGKYVYRSGRARGGRAGQGGPQLKFDTLNGDIRLHSER